VRSPEQIIGRDALVQLVFEGYVVLPAEPTEEMVRAAHASTAGWLGLPGRRSALSQALAKHAHRYRAMVRNFTRT
jgi:hypothetical protein